MATATRYAGASIDLEALDALVVRTAMELYCAGSHSRTVSERARESVLSGDVLSALRWAEHEKGGSGAVLEDKRLLFKLKKQHFLELALAADGTEDLELALRYCREDLAPLALEAYPEAYDEFKSAMFAACREIKKRNNQITEDIGHSATILLLGRLARAIET